MSKLILPKTAQDEIYFPVRGMHFDSTVIEICCQGLK